MDIAQALDAHTDNIFLRYCSLFIIKIHYQNTVKEPYNQCWAVTSYCNLVTVIILLFAVTSSVTSY